MNWLENGPLELTQACYFYPNFSYARLKALPSLGTH